MTQAKDFPFVPRHALDDVDEWRADLKHVADLRGIVHRRGVSAESLKDLLDYETRLALIAALFPDERAALYAAVTRGAGVAHAAVLCQRRARDEAGGTILMTEPGQPAAHVEADDPNLAAPAWLNGLSLALIARDRGAINTLAAPASIDATAQPAATIDPFWQPYCAAFAAALVEPDATAAEQWIEIAVHALDEAHISDKARIQQVHYPLLPLLASLARRNAQAFNVALLDALQHWRAYYAHPDQYRDWNGLISIPLNGLCAAASDAGLPIEVESDYLLQDLIAGSFPRELTKVTLYYPPRAIADADEARWFLDLEGIPRRQRQHNIVERDGQLVARYTIKDAPGLAHAVAEFLLPPTGANAEPALDVGELVYLAEVYSGAAGSDAQGRIALQDAIRCVELALKRLPAQGAIRFHARRGREVYEAEPGRFDRERLTAYLESLKKSLGERGGDTGKPPQREREGDASETPPPMSQEEVRAGALILMAAIQTQVMPLLQALAHDETGQIVAQIKPRDEDYARVFVGEAAALARDAYAALWTREPPRTAQVGVVDVKASLAPAGMLGDENDLSRQFPQGYRAIARWLQPGRVWVAWKYVKPGATSGEAYNGLVWVDDHWAWFPKPFRVLRALAEK